VRTYVPLPAGLCQRRRQASPGVQTAGRHSRADAAAAGAKATAARDGSSVKPAGLAVDRHLEVVEKVGAEHAVDVG